MDAHFDERYSRHFPLHSIGKENQKKLKYRHALIAGMGGLGTSSAELLASIGVGNLRIIDYDVIELSNLPRQKLYQEMDIGKAKVDIAEERLVLRNPTIKIDAQATRIDAISAYQLIDGIDVIVDGLDRFFTRKILHKASYEQKIPFVFAGAIGETANVMTITHENNTPCLECALGEVRDNEERTCERVGVHPSILQIATGIQVTETIKLMLDQKPNLVGTMLFVDLESYDFEKISFSKRDDCKLCGENEEGELDKGKSGDITKGFREIGDFGKALVTSLCGKDTFIIDPKWEIKWNFDEVKDTLRKKYNFAIDGKNYATFNDQGIGISLLSSGIATIRGAESSKNAVNAYERIITHILFKN